MTLIYRRTPDYKPGLFWFCLLALLWTTLLLFVGGFTTSIEAGMAFLDWPLSNGSINPEGWLEDRMMRAEHSHRLLGMKVGLLSIALFLWIYLREKERWLRLLATVTLAAVVLQGLLGGMRVLFDQLNIGTDSNVLAQTFAILHACGAQVVLCLLVTITIGCSKSWKRRADRCERPLSLTTKALGLSTCALLSVQILIGAVIRHTHTGLAIFTFPHTTPQGEWLPKAWNWAIAGNFAHRAAALVITAFLLGFIARIWASPTARRSVGLLTPIPMVLLAAQIFLGATVIWTRINEHAATMHLLVGAFLLASCWMLTFLCLRHPNEKRSVQLTL